MSEKERRIIAEVQRLPLTSTPYADIADRLDMSVDDLLISCQSLMDKGMIRRFGPSIAHRKMGFNANPMTAVNVPTDRLEEVGSSIAQEEDVTHCYSRDGWDYNLFFMVHGKEKEEARNRAASIADKYGGYPRKILFSVKELKKTSFEIPREDHIGTMEGGK